MATLAPVDDGRAVALAGRLRRRCIACRIASAPSSSSGSSGGGLRAPAAHPDPEPAPSAGIRASLRVEGEVKADAPLRVGGAVALTSTSTPRLNWRTPRLRERRPTVALAPLGRRESTAPAGSDLPELRDHIRARRAALAGFMEQGAALAIEGDVLSIVPRNDIYIRYLNDNRGVIGEMACDLFGRPIRAEISAGKATPSAPPAQNNIALSADLSRAETDDANARAAAPARRAASTASVNEAAAPAAATRRVRPRPRNAPRCTPIPSSSGSSRRSKRGWSKSARRSPQPRSPRRRLSACTTIPPTRFQVMTPTQAIDGREESTESRIEIRVHRGASEVAELDLSALMKQAAALQDKLKDMQATAAERVVTAESGGGMVRATVDGSMRVRKVEIDPAMLAANDKAMLEDLIVVAVNEGLRRAQEMVAEEMAKLGPLGGLKFPGFGGD